MGCVAWACGVPVIISDKVNIWPEIAEDKAGIVKADTAEGTYQGMKAFLAMGPEDRLMMVRNGVDCFRGRYEMKRSAAALNELF
jgi:glycosyltransferase involved in cell wall biosynthesis